MIAASFWSLLAPGRSGGVCSDQEGGNPWLATCIEHCAVLTIYSAIDIAQHNPAYGANGEYAVGERMCAWKGTFYLINFYFSLLKSGDF